jgi:hypothetical protein
VTERDSQISSLLDKLHQFNQQYDGLQKFVQDGNELLAGEKPVGENAARVQEQMDTCQVWVVGLSVVIAITSHSPLIPPYFPSPPFFSFPSFERKLESVTAVP